MPLIVAEEDESDTFNNECMKCVHIMDNAGSDRPQGRTALTGRQLDRYKIKIAALRETHLVEEGVLKDVDAGYTFFWSGRKKEEQH